MFRFKDGGLIKEIRVCKHKYHRKTDKQTIFLWHLWSIVTLLWPKIETNNIGNFLSTIQSHCPVWPSQHVLSSTQSQMERFYKSAHLFTSVKVFTRLTQEAVSDVTIHLLSKANLRWGFSRKASCFISPAGNPTEGDRIRTIDLLVQTSLDQLLVVQIF